MPKRNRKFGKITNVSIAVTLSGGRAIFSPWFRTSKQAKNYIRRELKAGGWGGKVLSVTKYVWREGMTIDDVERVRLKSL
ncbi:MAG: hypothetical protein JRD89_01170 [Deltaproteobacteria bacterium]|nr:hypothetical protein [Deltaproteobacteria bacterium]